MGEEARMAMTRKDAALAPLAGRRVLVTGHTGFKGSWLTLALVELGAEVSGFALPPPTEPSHFVLADVEPTLRRHRLGDVRDEAALASLLDEADPEVIFHLAAQPLVRASYQAPHETFAINTMGTANLLEQLRVRARPCAVVIVTSDKVYENVGRAEGYREGDPLGGHDPYSASKAAAEIVAASYRRSFFPPDRLAEHGVRVATARAGNVIGGGDFARDRIVVDAITALGRGLPIPVRNPLAIRPWQHVLEPVLGYCTLAARLLEDESGALCDAWNFGPRDGDELSVGGLVERILAAWGEGRSERVVEARAVHEAAVLRLDARRADERLGVRSLWSVDEAVARTVGWYRALHDLGIDATAAAARGVMRERTMADLRTYRERAA